MRLDAYLSLRGLVKSRTHAKALIEEGSVTVNGKTVTKAACEIGEDDDVSVSETLRYVGRGGLKLEKALDAFRIDVHGKKCLDIGASTGGFTDCLLQNGAASVTAVDAGQDQLDARLRADPRVTVMEKVNGKDLPDLIENHVFDLVVMDVSFVSATVLLPVFPKMMKEGGEAVLLVKPQFEIPGKRKNGIVKEKKIWRQALEKVLAAVLNNGMTPVNVLPSPIRGGDGNTEFLCHIKGKGETPVSFDLVERMLASL